MAGRIYDDLARRYGKDNVFFDVEGIHGGELWRSALDRKLAECDVFVAAIGEHWLEELASRPAAEDLVRHEARSALASGVRIVPVVMGKASMPRRSDLPEELRMLADYQYVPVRGGADFSGDAERLAGAIGGGTEKRPQRAKWIAGGALAMLAVLALMSALPKAPDLTSQAKDSIALTGGGRLEIAVSPRLQVGERATLTVSADRDVFVQVFHFTADEYPTELFPADSGGKGTIPAGKEQTISWKTTAPGGTEKVKVFASSRPLMVAPAAGETKERALRTIFAPVKDESRGIPEAIKASPLSDSDPTLAPIDSGGVSYLLIE
jgi:hypothetical protein